MAVTAHHRKGLSSLKSLPGIRIRIRDRVRYTFLSVFPLQWRTRIGIGRFHCQKPAVKSCLVKCDGVCVCSGTEWR